MVDVAEAPPLQTTGAAPGEPEQTAGRGRWVLRPPALGALVVEGIAVGAVIGTVIASSIAGVGFGWLRVRSDSLLAPILAHIATNSVTFAVAWIYWH
jgi:ABC-type uncharacterized transport system permease subunit